MSESCVPTQCRYQRVPHKSVSHETLASVSARLTSVKTLVHTLAGGFQLSSCMAQLMAHDITLLCSSAPVRARMNFPEEIQPRNIAARDLGLLQRIAKVGAPLLPES